MLVLLLYYQFVLQNGKPTFEVFKNHKKLAIAGSSPERFNYDKLIAKPRASTQVSVQFVTIHALNEALNFKLITFAAYYNNFDVGVRLQFFSKF
jgi:hypothetical protein